MERQHLIKLIDTKGASSKEETTELWDIVRTFPYFQAARLLLAKSFHKQGSIHFHNELKTAAAYAVDRKVLFNLINREDKEQNGAPMSNVFALERKESFDSPEFERIMDDDSNNQFILPGVNEDLPETSLFEINADAIAPAELKFEKPEITEEMESVPEPNKSAFDEPSTSREDIVRRRLSEILSRSKPEYLETLTKDAAHLKPQTKEKETNSSRVEVVNETPPEVVTSLVKEETPSIHSAFEELPSKANDAIEGLEIETIIGDNYLWELEKLPEIAEPAVNDKQGVNSKAEPIQIGSRFSFIDWLKQKNQKETTVEEVGDEGKHFLHEKEITWTKPVAKSSELVNKFIAAAPRIVPPKTDFYSPSNMAKLSITDNEDIVSETLARLYFDQGNYLKARSCYEKLSLLYPEKSASFAPLIGKIDNILKENQT